MGRKQRVARAIALTIACSLAGIGWYARKRIKFKYKYSVDITGILHFEPKRSVFYALVSRLKELNYAANSES